MTAVAEALELEPVESHLHPEGSFDVAAKRAATAARCVWSFQ